MKVKNVLATCQVRDQTSSYKTCGITDDVGIEGSLKLIRLRAGAGWRFFGAIEIGRERNACGEPDGSRVHSIGRQPASQLAPTARLIDRCGWGEAKVVKIWLRQGQKRLDLSAWQVYVRIERSRKSAAVTADRDISIPQPQNPNVHILLLSCLFIGQFNHLLTWKYM